MLLLFSLLSFLSTLLGGLYCLKYHDHIHRFLGFTAGVLLGVVAFDILPELMTLIQKTHLDPRQAMIALVLGFLVFHILEKFVLIHHSQEGHYPIHKHPSVGVLSALALSGHSFLDGVGIGLGFQVSPALGILVAFAVISHDFADGVNTVSLMLINQNPRKKALQLLLVDAITPVLGAVSTMFFTLPDRWLVLYLGFFCGFLLYIGASDILPEAHSKDSSIKTVLMTILGTVFIFVVTQFV